MTESVPRFLSKRLVSVVVVVMCGSPYLWGNSSLLEQGSVQLLYTVVRNKKNLLKTQQLFTEMIIFSFERV